MDSNFYNLTIDKAVKETADATSLYFSLTPELKEQFSFEAGQYLTLKFNLDGEDYRRAYSICTSPLDDELAVTVKRVEGGKISNHINSNIDASNRVEVMRPMGKFVLNLNPENNKTYYFFAGGSGITPMMSIIKTVLRTEPNSTCHLLYGSRDEDNIIFENELKELEAKNADNLMIRYILSHPKENKATGLSGLFGKKKVAWQGWSGFMTKEKINQFLSENASSKENKHYLICGPSAMMDLVNESLATLNISSKNIMIEYFASPKTEKTKKTTTNFSGASKVKVQLKGQEHLFEIDDNTTILDALVKKGVEPPFSCLSGTCSTCMAKVTKGSVEMDECLALEDDEIEQGLVLTCQSHPTASEVEINYDV